MSSSTNQNTNARSMNGIITIDDGNGTIIEDGVISTTGLEILGNMNVVNLNVNDEIVADVFSLSHPDSTSKFNLDDTFSIGKTTFNSSPYINVDGDTIINGSVNIQDPNNYLLVVDDNALTYNANKNNLSKHEFNVNGSTIGYFKHTGLVVSSGKSITADTFYLGTYSLSTLLGDKIDKAGGTFTGDVNTPNNINLTGTSGRIDFNGGCSKIYDNVDLNIETDDKMTLKAPTSLTINSPSVSFNGTVTGITKAMVGLTNVDNSSDLNKPISTPTSTALGNKMDKAGGTFTGDVNTPNNINLTGTSGRIDFNGGCSKIYDNVDLNIETDDRMTLKAPTSLTINSPSVSFNGTVTGITKAMVGLTNVDNTSDLNKPISTPTSTALGLKAPSASPSFTGGVYITDPYTTPTINKALIIQNSSTGELKKEIGFLTNLSSGYNSIFQSGDSGILASGANIDGTNTNALSIGIHTATTVGVGIRMTSTAVNIGGVDVTLNATVTHNGPTVLNGSLSVGTHTISTSGAVATGQITSTSARIGNNVAGYMFDTGSASYPIFCSVSDLNILGMDNRDDKYFVMPGYQIDIWSDTGYSGLLTSFTNVTGTKVLYASASVVNRASSCRVYFLTLANEVTITGLS